MPLRARPPAFPIVTVALVAINMVAYLLGSATAAASSAARPHRRRFRYGAIPYELTHPGKHCELITAAYAERRRRIDRLPGLSRV